MLPRAQDFIRWLETREIRYRLVTNNATLTPQQYAEKLAAMGIEAHPSTVFTSALATAMYLERQGARGTSAFVIGEEGLLSALEEVGIHTVDRSPKWVVAGLDRTLTYDKLRSAALAIEQGATFIGTNPDTSLPTELGLEPGAGAIQVALTATTGVEPVVIGKPQPLMLELAMEALGGTTADTAMLGDRLNTDIEAAAALGMPSILILTGVSTRQELTASKVQPSLVVDDLAELMRCWEADSAPAGGSNH